jgi:hypothetical protein
MAKERIDATQKEQDWIEKYRAALDARLNRKSRMKSMCATFGKVAGILSSAMRSILAKRPVTSPNEAGSKQPTTAGLVPTPIVPDQRLSAQMPVVEQGAPREQSSPQHQSEAKAS